MDTNTIFSIIVMALAFLGNVFQFIQHNRMTKQIKGVDKNVPKK